MDEKRRELQRLAASGDVEAAAAVLGERVRRGELPRERVELAAMLGHQAASWLCPNLRTMGWGLREVSTSARMTRDLLDKPTLPTLFSADCWERSLSVTSELEADAMLRVRRAIAASRVWADCPCDPHRVRYAVHLGILDPSMVTLAEVCADLGACDPPTERTWQQRRLAAYLLGEA